MHVVYTLYISIKWNILKKNYTRKKKGSFGNFAMCLQQTIDKWNILMFSIIPTLGLLKSVQYQRRIYSC